MSFVYPGLLILAVILPFILLGAILAHRGRSNAWQGFVAARLQKKLVNKGSNTRRWISLALALLGCACLIVTIARPYYGETRTTDQVTSRNVIIAIDTSRSMLVRDGSPDRVTAAKAIAIELIKAFPNDRVGIIAFSGRPVLMVPLTVDHGAVLEVIGQLDTRMIPSGGSDLAAAAELSIETFKKTGQAANALIIISDGEDHSVKTDLAGNSIREAGIRVCAISVGTTEGGLIPDPRMRDGYFRDHQGNTVTSRMVPDALQQISNTGKGTYLPASKGADRLIRSALASLESEQQEGEEASVPNERYYWFLIPAVILILLSILVRTQFSMRSKLNPTVITLLVLFITLSNQQVEANTFDANTHAQQAKSHYEKQDYEAAIESFSKALPNFKNEKLHGIEFAIGSSSFRLEQWEKAIHYFSKALITENKNLQEQSHYNLANSLFQSGHHMLHPTTEGTQQAPDIAAMIESAGPQQPDKAKVITIWEDSLTHYQAALAISPDNADAEHNRKEVEKLLEELKEEKKQEEEQQKQDQENKEKGDEGEEGEDEGEESEDGEDGEDEGEEGEDGEEGDEEGEEGDESQDGDEGEEQSSEQNQQEPQESEQEEGESDEEFAARILKDESDLETRPTIPRLRNPQRSAKDW
ncbi:VWA domain-containing protein [Akkermansiaceae bacterium]|nr:VWA domain-containing protein [Akkermansiaceae bacterium]